VPAGTANADSSNLHAQRFLPSMMPSGICSEWAATYCGLAIADGCDRIIRGLAGSDRGLSEHKPASVSQFRMPLNGSS
jgi:hypothetical protein